MVPAGISRAIPVVAVFLGELDRPEAIQALFALQFWCFVIFDTRDHRWQQ